jgi:hypothetical protein
MCLDCLGSPSFASGMAIVLRRLPVTCALRTAAQLQLGHIAAASTVSTVICIHEDTTAPQFACILNETAVLTAAAEFTFIKHCTSAIFALFLYIRFQLISLASQNQICTKLFAHMISWNISVVSASPEGIFYLWVSLAKYCWIRRSTGFGLIFLTSGVYFDAYRGKL